LAALKLGDVVIHGGPRRVRLPDTVAGGNASKFLQRTYVPFLVRIIKNNNALSLHFGSGRMNAGIAAVAIDYNEIERFDWS